MGLNTDMMLEEVATASIIKGAALVGHDVAFSQILIRFIVDVKRPADLTMDSKETYDKLSSWGCSLPLSLSAGVARAMEEGPV
jgi:hypothetical protein